MSFRSHCACLNTPRLICGTNRLSEEIPVIIVNIDRMVQRISHQDLAHSIYSYSRRNHRQSLAGRSGRELRHISAIICKELDCRVNSVTHNDFLSVVHTDFATEVSRDTPGMTNRCISLPPFLYTSIVLRVVDTITLPLRSLAML